MSLLERSGLVFLLEPWSWSADGFGNAGKRLSRSPKLYWSDTGLLCWLMSIDNQPLAAAVGDWRDSTRSRKVLVPGERVGGAEAKILLSQRAPH